MNEPASFEGMLSRLVEEAVRRALPEKRVPEKRLVRMEEAAEMIGVSPRSLERLIARGEIPTRRVESIRATLIAVADLDRWAESLPRRNGHEQEAEESSEWGRHRV